MAEPKTLIVKHLPSELTAEEREELLKLFGATKVKCMPDEGKMKFAAFASFESIHAAKVALSRLHQLEILNKRLVVEFVKKEENVTFPRDEVLSLKSSVQDEHSFKASEKEKLKMEMEKFSANLHGICPALGLEYIPSPLLKYKYPLPTPTIIGNIAHALAAVPKFYTQVLHLMNKMNLPAPFGPLTPSPPLMPDEPVKLREGNGLSAEYTRGDDFYEVKEMDTSSSEESELESNDEDGDHPKADIILPLKRQGKKQKRRQKKMKLQQLLLFTNVPTTVSGPRAEPSDVFDSQPQIDAQKKIQFNLKPTLDSNVVSDAQQISVVDQDYGGFGILPVSKTDINESNDNENSEEEDFEMSEFISMRELRRKRLSYREMKTLSIFRNYDPGEPTVRLYIKNLARQVEEKDLRYLFGRFIDSNSETDKNMFDVRLMKEGRMKGQAFVTLANEEQAQRAVKETNGFVLHAKPLVVQFARSSKPKDVPNKPQSKRT